MHLRIKNLKKTRQGNVFLNSSDSWKVKLVCLNMNLTRVLYIGDSASEITVLRITKSGVSKIPTPFLLSRMYY